MPVLLGAPKGESLVHDRAERELVDESAEDAEHEHAAALAAGHDRLAHRGRPVGLQPELLLDLVVEVLRPGAVRLHPDRLDAHVRAAAAGALLQFGGDVCPGVVQGLGADVRAHLLSRSGAGR